MPRGVPKNGVRRPRTVRSAEPETAGAEPTVAPGPVDVLDVDPVPTPEPEAATSDDVLTADQREIKRLRDQLARERGRKDVEPEVDQQEQQADDGDIILIHFLEDGLTVNGVIKYRGDELEFPVGSGSYRDTFNRNGVTWLDLRHDEFAQVERWGKIMFRPGPWPGKTYADGTWESLRAEKGDGFVAAPSKEEIEAAEKARSRSRRAPRIPQQV